MNLNLSSTITTDRYPLRREIIRLSQAVGKPLLRLSAKDYMDHGLWHLTEKYGSAAQTNIEVFNQLQHTITGWPGGKPDADDSTRPERAQP
ncbi:MAG: glucosamine-6-phosphate deaminase, partial [Bacteroidales bacterium]|nr:glucosamine-6-phosphate deaminase [Bacteroidales bacterium]